MMVAEEDKIQGDDYADPSTCTHHWIIERPLPQHPTSWAICLLCADTKEFPKATDRTGVERVVWRATVGSVGINHGDQRWGTRRRIKNETK